MFFISLDTEVKLEIFLCHHNLEASKLCLGLQEIGGNFILAENEFQNSQ